MVNTSVEFSIGDISSIADLREKQLSDLKGQIFDPVEEKIQLDKPCCIVISNKGKRIGYILIDTKNEPEKIILEYFLLIEYRKDAKFILERIIDTYKCTSWYVNTYDSFALPLMIECGFPNDIDGFIFSINKEVQYKKIKELPVCMANSNDLEEVYDFIMQDGFFTGAGKEDLLARIKTGELYLLHLHKLIGVGFISPLLRTPNFSDIAMIIDKEYRGQGYATQLVEYLIATSFQLKLQPTALTSKTNIASRKTLQKCGFYIDGCMLLCNLLERS